MKIDVTEIQPADALLVTGVHSPSDDFLAILGQYGNSVGLKILIFDEGEFGITILRHTVRLARELDESPCEAWSRERTHASHEFWTGGEDGHLARCPGYGLTDIARLSDAVRQASAGQATHCGFCGGATGEPADEINITGPTPGPLSFECGEWTEGALAGSTLHCNLLHGHAGPHRDPASKATWTAADDALARP